MNKLSQISKTQLILLFSALVVFAVVIWAYATVPTSESNHSTKHIMTYTDNTIREEENGKLVWEVHADKISVDAATQIASMENVNGKFYRKDGSMIEIKATKASYNQEKSIMDITDGLSIHSTDGMSIDTKKIIWNGKDGILTAEGGVIIKKGTMIATADKAISKDAFSDFKLQGHAQLKRE